MATLASRKKLGYKSPCLDNAFASKFVGHQNIAVIPSFTLESGKELVNFPVAFKTWGRLSARADNALVVCHALTGTADVARWWGELLGPGRAFDTSRFFVICFNSLGSPYGSASPVTARNGDPTNGPYGPDFPHTTIRDDVNVFRLILRDLGVRNIAAVVGGSMGGMLALEFALAGAVEVRSVVTIATAARFSAWGIAWGEVQRQSIYADANFAGGRYTQADPPSAGLAAARMAAMLTYRSYASLEDRFGRDEQQNGCFQAQAYLRYQGTKFTERFDANCYLALTRKLDSHDLARGRASCVRQVLARITQPALIITIPSDGLFEPAEQAEVAECIPRAEHKLLRSPVGHDAFLLENEQVAQHLKSFWQTHLPDIVRPFDPKDGDCKPICGLDDDFSPVIQMPS
ncbi:hypothetical protein SLS57_009254 [Botryosphaeria dothidea]